MKPLCSQMADVERFHIAFPHSEDYHTALGFFLASGLPEPVAHANAEAACVTKKQGEDHMILAPSNRYPID